MAHTGTEVPPPLQDIPTAKEKKYDRQLRLWGAAGQIALENTHVLLINNGTGVTGVETLKNLVLPGVGQFSILDSKVVDEADLGVNFFLEDASLGKFRAEETTKLLNELNEDVVGHAITEPLESWIAKENAFRPFTLVLVAAPIEATLLQTINTQTRQLNIPTIYTHCVGFYSHFSLSLPPAYPIVDTHPDSTAMTDLRLMRPWPELLSFAQEKTQGMDKMSGEEFAHIPYVCLLLHYLEQWKEQNGGKLPETYKEKSAFRDIVRSGSATEENFDEAYAAVLKSLNPPTASSSVREILNAPEAQNLTPESPPFWLIANAVQQFYTKHSQLPLPGAVPDMKAKSETYIQLQNLYKAKARKDCAEVTQTVRELESHLGRTSHLAVEDKTIENFCKGAAHISLVRGRPLKIITPGTNFSFNDRAKSLANELTNPESLISLYLAFLAWDEFLSTHHSSPAELGGEGFRMPGATSATASTSVDVDSDAEKLTGIAHQLIDNLLSEADIRIENPEYDNLKAGVGKICVELTRAGGAELHNIASLTGGLVAQEAIKVITEQYVPVDNTCVFDGVESRSWVGRV